MYKKLYLAALVLTAGTFLNAQTKTGIHLVSTFHIASSGSWDYLAVEPGSNHLYVSHGTQVNILDKKTGDSIGVIQNTIGVHGIAFIPADGFGYTSNGRINNISVFSLKDFHVTAQIPVSANPDAIMYEPFTKRIITCNGRGRNLNLINPDLNQISDSIAVDGKPETAVSDGAGHLYVNIEDKNEIVQVDLTTKKVTAHWSLAPAEGPTGLAYDRNTRRLFAGCENKLVVVDATNGKIVATLPIGGGCDGDAFDPSTKNIYTSNGDGTMTVIHEDDADHYKVVENIPTKKGGRTITLDESTHTIYIPTADFEVADPASNARPKMIPGTFQVLVFGK